MNLMVIWVGFIIFISIFQELNLLHYLFFNILILWFTYLYNLIKPLEMSPKIFILFLSIPSIIICYITFIYNSFLLVTLVE
jgi:hypothetical protein